MKLISPDRAAPRPARVSDLRRSLGVETATGFLATLSWDQARALLREGAKHRDPLAARSKLLLLGAMGLFGLLPYTEEPRNCCPRRNPTLKPLPERR